MPLNQVLDGMTLADLGNIGEFIGAIGVVISLLYIAVQIRQNTKAVRSATFQGISDQLMKVLSLRIQDPALAEIRWKAASAPDQLTQQEYSRLSDLLEFTFIAYQNIFVQFQNGFADIEQWNAVESSIRRYATLPGFKDWWRRSSNGLPHDFKRVVDEIVDETDKHPT